MTSTSTTRRNARRSLRLAATVTGVTLAAGSLFVAVAGSGQAETGDGAVPGAAASLVVPATGVGSIPDGLSFDCPAPGAPLDLSFVVSGVTGPLTDVRVGLTMTHTWVGDVVATLIAPNAASHVLFGRTGATAAGPGSSTAIIGDNGNLSGSYSFADDATLGWWAAAAAGTSSSDVVPPGAYRASAIGGVGSTGAPTSITPAFAGVPDPNGTWTLRLTDGCDNDEGAVSAASLELSGAATSPTATPTSPTATVTVTVTAAPGCSTQQAAVTAAQAKRSSADGVAGAAQAAATAADQSVVAATAAVTAGDKGVGKAKAKLKAAKKAGDAAKVKKAKAKLKAAKATLEAARAALTAAQQGATTAKQQLATAQAAATAARSGLTAAQAALDACLATL